MTTTEQECEICELRIATKRLGMVSVRSERFTIDTCKECAVTTVTDREIQTPQWIQDLDNGHDIG